ncbi:MAG: DUF4388 domain-containing protein [Deltaproteobacteria bacterium]|nr:DUF4388 domain-containing protein [Deltaproteobacteria bacterium]
MNSEKGFRGTLSNISLTDLIQMTCQSSMTTTIKVTEDKKVGHIFIDKGQITHATYGRLSGEDAFNTILSWENGAFETITPPVPNTPPITKDWMYLVLEAARAIDEIRGKRTAAELAEDGEAAEDGLVEEAPPVTGEPIIYDGPTLVEDYIQGDSGLLPMDAGPLEGGLQEDFILPLATDDSYPGGLEVMVDESGIMAEQESISIITPEFSEPPLAEYALEMEPDHPFAEFGPPVFESPDLVVEAEEVSLGPEPQASSEPQSEIEWELPTDVEESEMELTETELAAGEPELSLEMAESAESGLDFLPGSDSDTTYPEPPPPPLPIDRPRLTIRDVTVRTPIKELPKVQTKVIKWGGLQIPDEAQIKIIYRLGLFSIALSILIATLLVMYIKNNIPLMSQINTAQAKLRGVMIKGAKVTAENQKVIDDMHGFVEDYNKIEGVIKSGSIREAVNRGIIDLKRNTIQVLDNIFYLAELRLEPGSEGANLSGLVINSSDLTFTKPVFRAAINDTTLYFDVETLPPGKKAKFTCFLPWRSTSIIEGRIEFFKSWVEPALTARQLFAPHQNQEKTPKAP